MSKKLPLIDIINELFHKYKDYEHFDVFKAVKYGCTHPYFQSNEDHIRKLLMAYGIYTVNSHSYLKVERNINNLGNIPENAIIILFNGVIIPDITCQALNKNTNEIKIVYLFNNALHECTLFKKQKGDIKCTNKISSFKMKRDIVLLNGIVFPMHHLIRDINFHKNTLFILDLRGNSGGSLCDAILLLEQFIPKGYPLFFINELYQNNKQVVTSNSIKTCLTNVDIVVIIDKTTMSSAEIVAGVLQKYGGLIVGEKSFGKSVIQKKVKYENKELLIPKYIYSIDGNPFEGVLPNIYLCDIQKRKLKHKEDVYNFLVDINQI